MSSFTNCELPACAVLMSQDGRTDGRTDRQTRLPSSETELIPAVHGDDKQNADQKVIRCRREIYVVSFLEAVDSGQVRLVWLTELHFIVKIILSEFPQLKYTRAHYVILLCWLTYSPEFNVSTALFLNMTLRCVLGGVVAEVSKVYAASFFECLGVKI